MCDLSKTVIQRNTKVFRKNAAKVRLEIITLFRESLPFKRSLHSFLRGVFTWLCFGGSDNFLDQSVTETWAEGT